MNIYNLVPLRSRTVERPSQLNAARRQLPLPPQPAHTYTRTEKHVVRFFFFFFFLHDFMAVGLEPLASDIWAPHKLTEWRPPPVFNCFAPPCVASKKTTRRQMDVQHPPPTLTHPRPYTESLRGLHSALRRRGSRWHVWRLIERCRVSVAAERRESAKEPNVMNPSVWDASLSVDKRAGRRRDDTSERDVC